MSNSKEPNAEVGRTPSLDELRHHNAITNVLCVHSRGLDRGNAELLKSAYWPDAEVDYGGFKGNAHQFAERIGPILKSVYELTQHSLGQSFIVVDGENAKSETYITARHLLKGADQHMIFFGRYLDQLVYREGLWKIIHRQVVMDWNHRSSVTDERNSEAFGALTKGSMSTDDHATIFFGSH